MELACREAPDEPMLRAKAQTRRLQQTGRCKGVGQGEQQNSVKPMPAVSLAPLYCCANSECVCLTVFFAVQSEKYIACRGHPAAPDHISSCHFRQVPANYTAVRLVCRHSISAPSIASSISLLLHGPQRANGFQSKREFASGVNIYPPPLCPNWQKQVS